MPVDKLYTLTEQDLRILELARAYERDPNGRILRCGSFFTSFYFRTPDQPVGWTFDHNIIPGWQLECHHAPQKDIVVIGGMGSSKTAGIAMSAVTHAGTNDDFKFLNVAPTAWQSKQMYDYILAQAAGTLFEERFLFKFIERPFPKITLKHRLPGKGKVPGRIITSTLEFMSGTEDAQTIRTWEGDWVNVDQAELIDNLSDLWANLGTRTRGITRSGRARMGRLSAIANAEDNPELWALAELAEYFPETNRFFLVSTFHNKNLSDSDIGSFQRRLGNDKERIAQFMHGERPLGKGVEFSSALVQAAIDPNLDKEMDHHIQNETPGWFRVRTKESDVIHWQMPYDRTKSYIVVGDPGQGHPPLRNAPVVMVFDVTNYPDDPLVLTAFWWGDGGGKYEPWITQFLHWMDFYNAINGGYDATGGQKVHSELTFDKHSQIWPIDLSNIKKRSYMVTLKLVMQRKLLRLPGDIKGLNYQLLKYRLPDEKIPQDLVSTLFILAGCLWAMGFESPDDPLDEKPATLLPQIQNRYSRTVMNRYDRNRARTR